MHSFKRDALALSAAAVLALLLSANRSALASSISALSLSIANAILTFNGALYGPVYSFTDPTLQSWTWVNQSTATVDTAHGGIILANTVTSGAAQDVHARMIPAPATPYHVVAAFTSGTYTVSNGSAGLIFSDGLLATNKAITFTSHFATPVNQVVAFTLTTFINNNATLINDQNHRWDGPLTWLRLGDDGTNRTYDVSSNGVNWFTYLSEPRATFLTAADVGFYINLGPDFMQLFSFQITP